MKNKKVLLSMAGKIIFTSGNSYISGIFSSVSSTSLRIFSVMRSVEKPSTCSPNRWLSGQGSLLSMKVGAWYFP